MNKRVNFTNLFVLILFFMACNTAPATGKDKPITLDTDPNLAGWWKLDEISGKTAADSSRYDHKGMLKNGSSFDKKSAQGRVGHALKLDKDDYIEIVNYKGVSGTQPRTVAAWIKTTNAEGEIISWGRDDPGAMFKFCFIRSRVGVTPNGGYLYMAQPVDDNKWHHVAVVVQPAELPNLQDDVILYLDGTPVEIDDIGLLDLFPIKTGNDLNVTIGRQFEGLIDEVRIYDRALSEDQIEALFKLQSNSPISTSR